MFWIGSNHLRTRFQILICGVMTLFFWTFEEKPGITFAQPGRAIFDIWSTQFRRNVILARSLRSTMVIHRFNVINTLPRLFKGDQQKWVRHSVQWVKLCVFCIFFEIYHFKSTFWSILMRIIIPITTKQWTNFKVWFANKLMSRLNVKWFLWLIKK